METEGETTSTRDILATEASRDRLARARSITAHCPPSLAGEIAVTGSVARGVADDYSDVEMNLWVHVPPSWGAFQSWLKDAGATEVRESWEKADVAGFRWTVCSFGGIWFEIGWAEMGAFDAFVRDLAAGAYIGHQRLQMGWTVIGAIPLRTEGQLATWQATLSRYPHDLAERVIADQTSVWADPHVPGVRWALAARGERMGLALRFVWDMQNLLRVLFAVNDVWDRDLKWTDARALDLLLAPLELSARIDAMFTLTDLYRAVEINQRLIIETLEVARDAGFEVSGALQSMRNGLREGLKG